MNTFRVNRVVEFGDTDMAGIVHFANFLRFMEAAEHAYLRACGLSVVTTWQGQKITFPRVSVACDYIRPARFEDELTTEVRVDRIGRTSITYRFTVTRAGDENFSRTPGAAGGVYTRAKRRLSGRRGTAGRRTREGRRMADVRQRRHRQSGYSETTARINILYNQSSIG